MNDLISRSAMKEKLIEILAISLFAVFIVWLAGGFFAEAVNDDLVSFRFSAESFKIGGGTYGYVITDNSTGQQYLFIDSYNAGGLTKMEG